MKSWSGKKVFRVKKDYEKVGELFPFQLHLPRVTWEGGGKSYRSAKRWSEDQLHGKDEDECSMYVRSRQNEANIARGIRDYHDITSTREAL